MQPSEEQLEIKAKWIARLENGEKITLKWDAGGDETPIWIYADGVELTDWEENVGLLDIVIRALDLPNAGEYFVEGGGELETKDGQLLIRHESHHTGVDYEYEGEEDDDISPYDESKLKVIEIDKSFSETVVLIP